MEKHEFRKVRIVTGVEHLFSIASSNYVENSLAKVSKRYGLVEEAPREHRYGYEDVLKWFVKSGERVVKVEPKGGMLPETLSAALLGRIRDKGLKGITVVKGRNENGEIEVYLVNVWESDYIKRK